MMMQRTANENAAYKRRICKRSDQPKIDRITNNARLILREKLNGATTRLSTVAVVGFQFGLYHVVAPLSFSRSISLALFGILTKYSINLAKNVKIVLAPENSSTPG